MVDIVFYKNSMYEDIKNILIESDLFDDVWEAKESLKRKITKDPESILVAKEGEEIIGCVFLVENGLNVFIFRLCVKEAYRKKGVGAALMKKAEEIMKGRGIKEVSFFVDPKKEGLQNWYKKQGYKPGNDWTFMYKQV